MWAVLHGELPLANGSNGRKANGQFDKGWEGGPGGSTTWKSRDYYDGYTQELSIKDIKKLARRVYKKAMSDDADAMIAAKDILDRVLGKPTEIVAGDTHNHYPILVTTTAEAVKKLEENRSFGDDPLRGVKRLPKGNGS